MSNWNYKCTDKFELIYKNNRSPKEYTDYPYIIGSYRANGTFVLFIRYNLENSRTCMNINYNDHWTGNDAISFSSPFDYDNYYLLGANADYFYLKKGTDLDHIDTTEFTWSTYSLITQSDGPVKLFCDNPDGANNPMDMSLYGIKAYNSSNDLIHNYIPIENGLLDTVDMTMYTTNTTGHINGPEVPNDFNGCIDSIWYKKNGIWIKNNVVDLDASKAIDIDYEDYILLPDIEKNDPTKVYYVYNAPGGSGEDYEGLSNKPKVNNVTLIGNKTSSDLGMVIPLTQKQYDALPYEDQMDPNKVYYITDEGGFDPKGQVGYLPAVYSEQEKMVGVWTDGKPLYQKTFKNVATETQLVSNVDELVDYKIKRHGYNDINYFDIGDGFAVNDSAVCVLSNNIVTYTCWASSQGYINKTADVITIQYTIPSR